MPEPPTTFACYYAAPADSDVPFHRGTATDVPDAAQLSVLPEAGGAAVTLPREAVFPRHETDETASDNAQLTHLNEAGLLANLMRRYDADSIYTYTGTVLHALNPYKRMPALYDEATRDAYRGKALGVMRPHVYAVADRARRMIVSERKDQSIVVSGESGAGKTFNCNLMISYLAALSLKHAELAATQAGAGASETATAALQEKVDVEKQVSRRSAVAWSDCCLVDQLQSSQRPRRSLRAGSRPAGSASVRASSRRSAICWLVGVMGVRRWRTSARSSRRSATPRRSATTTRRASGSF